MKDIRKDQYDSKVEEVLAAFYATEEGKKLKTLLDSDEINEQEFQEKLERALKTFMNKE